jgi:hypothetical protein
LASGDFNEADSHALFAEALNEWRTTGDGAGKTKIEIVEHFEESSYAASLGDEHDDDITATDKTAESSNSSGRGGSANLVYEDLGLGRDGNGYDSGSYSDESPGMGIYDDGGSFDSSGHDEGASIHVGLGGISAPTVYYGDDDDNGGTTPSSTSGLSIHANACDLGVISVASAVGSGSGSGSGQSGAAGVALSNDQAGNLAHELCEGVDPTGCMCSGASRLRLHHASTCTFAVEVFVSSSSSVSHRALCSFSP